MPCCTDGTYDIELDLLGQLKRRNPLRSAVLADQRSRRKALKRSITAKMRDKVLDVVEECAQRAIEVEPGSTKRPAASAPQESTADTFLDPPEPQASSSRLPFVASAPSPSSAPSSNTPVSPRPTRPKLIVFAGEKLVGRSTFATGADRSESLVSALLTELKAVPERLDVAVYRLNEFLTSQSCPSTACRLAREDYEHNFSNREECVKSRSTSRPNELTSVASRTGWHTLLPKASDTPSTGCFTVATASAYSTATLSARSTSCESASSPSPCRDRLCAQSTSSTTASRRLLA